MTPLNVSHISRRRFVSRLAAGSAALLIPGVGRTAQSPLREDYEQFVLEMEQRHQFDASALRQLLGRATVRQSILRAMNAPSTSRPFYDFRARHLDANRIAGGLRFWSSNRATLTRARLEFGVDEELIVATIGIETLYGRQTGTIPVLDALVTLAFDYPRRADFFRGELEQYLLLAREAGLRPQDIKGSFAGAIGIPQFLPSSYRKYAVDFDADGRRLLWEPADAIGSVASYYRAFGWEAGAPAVLRAEAGPDALEAVMAAGPEPVLRVADLRSLGVTPLDPVDETARAALFALEYESGLRYFLGLQNFYVITRYNRSHNYAMTVSELAQELRRQQA